MLDDVAAFLVIAPLAGGAVALWLLGGPGVDAEPAVKTSRAHRR